jgi:hypothetical protein
MLNKIVKLMPQGVKDNKVCQRLYQALKWAANIRPQYYFYYRKNSSRIREFKDIHRGQRCFIVGTGPSLNQTNLSLLNGEIVFGVNTLYRGLPEFGMKCAYYAVSDLLIWKTHFEGISPLETTLLLSDDAGKEYLAKKHSYRSRLNAEPFIIRNLGPIWEKGWLIKDLAIGAYFGYTVVVDICLQAAYYMGFKEAYLLGCDCDYNGLHRFDGLKTEAMGGGAIGDWSNVFASYEICKHAYEEDGREIINSTIGGKLEIFKRKKLEDVISSL